MKQIARLLEETYRPPVQLSQSSVRVMPRIRHKIWELPPTCHCPLVGTCLSVDDLRQLARRAGLDTQDMSDYLLHSVVVDLCGSRSEVAELLQRSLDQRYTLSIRRFAKAKCGNEILALWRQAVDDGNIAGSLWAAWTHPCIGDEEGGAIYGDVHMLSHQLGAQERSERRRLLAVEQKNTHLHDEVSCLRERLVSSQLEQKRCAELLNASRAEVDRLATQIKFNETALLTVSQTDASNRSLERRNEALSMRLTLMEQRHATQLRQIVELESELARSREAQRLANAVAKAAPIAEIDTPRDTPAHPDAALDIDLSGRRILCIGGRPGAVDHYRRLVETSGGYFIHHDGGQEENAHRLDTFVSSADAVICFASHVSHSAYWRIKSACKQRGLDCLFLRSGGITSFARSLDGLAEAFAGTCAAPARHMNSQRNGVHALQNA
ncbi:DUF2325 domain-containing protein [Chitinivorax sp. PXF-14]|uniref:DUF2325 domain-containing protein n=1 Tax=Chitinivorax sp. PXF-14 TaxID=3230488 RepID=UPI003465D869